MVAEYRQHQLLLLLPLLLHPDLAADLGDELEGGSSYFQ